MTAHPRPIRRSASWRAFTLLEILVAIGILAFMSLLTYESMSLTFKAREQIGRIEDLTHAARVGLRRLASDISMAYLSNHVDPREPASTTLFVGKTDSLLFSSLSHERRRRGARESDQNILEYRLERDPDSRQMALVRREKAIPDTEPERGGVKETLIVGVKEFRLYYWDDKAEDWKDDWRAEMEDASKSGLAGPLGGPVAPAGAQLMKVAQDKELEKFKLPSRVYVRLVLVDTDGTEFPFETQTRLHLQYPLNF